jgi:hypothetical protein
MTLEHHRNRLHEIRLRYGSISVRSLREFYGSFAPHCADSEKVGEILADLDAASLNQLVRDYKTGKLDRICRTPLELPRCSGPKCESHGNPGDNRNKGS